MNTATQLHHTILNYKLHFLLSKEMNLFLVIERGPLKKGKKQTKHTPNPTQYNHKLFCRKTFGLLQSILQYLKFLALRFLPPLVSFIHSIQHLHQILFPTFEL